jgi:hypothetical protein
MLVDTSFSFYLMNSWTNYYFCFHDNYNIDPNHQTLKIYSVNDHTNNYYYHLPEFDLYHVYLYCDLCSATNGFICEIMDERDK